MGLEIRGDGKRTFVGFAYDPGGCVAHAQVQDLAGLDHLVQALHEFGNARGEVPPMHIEQIYVVGLELLQGSIDRNAERLCAVAGIVDTLANGLSVCEGRRELCSDDDFLANLALFHPFSDPDFRFLVLVVVGAGELSAQHPHPLGHPD